MLIKRYRRQIVHPDSEAMSQFLEFNIEGSNSVYTDVVNEHLHACCLMRDDNRVVGRFALYVNDQLEHQGQPAICIGAYVCSEEEEAVRHLLSWAIELSSELGFKYCIGPMNGSTWYQYRFSIGSSQPKFGMDICNPNFYNQQFVDAGFERISNYFSGIEKIGTADIKEDKRLETHFRDKGLKTRSLNMEKLEDELFKIAEFSNEAFQNNFLFTPIEKSLFVQNYLKMASVMDSEFIQLTEDEKGQMCSLLFAIKDYKDKSGDTLVIKTIAAKRGFRYKGLSTYLVRKMTREAKKEGYKFVIHALMHESNMSLITSMKYATRISEYALYGRAI